MAPKIILASTSIYRQQILQKLQLPFECISPNTIETPLEEENAPSLVLRLAEAKAKAGVKHYLAKNLTDTENQLKSPAVVIGSDQVAVIDDQIIGKPLTTEKAIQQLQLASGKAITFYTGLSLVHSQTEQAVSLVETFTVHFRKLTLQEISRYVELEQPLYCAGSFKAEGLGIALFEKLEGDDPNTLIGLPLIKLITALKQFNVNVL